jgi:hypothetical protein
VIDASATNTTASYLQTPQGLYQITARTSDTVVTITTPSGYTNESAVAGTVWKKLFGITTPEITSISPNYTVFDVVTTQPSTVVTAATKMGILGFVTSDATRTISLTYNGEDRNTHVNTPLANLHNDLAGLQGGTATEYFHSTSAEYTGTGTGVFVRETSPVLVTPNLGTPSALVGTNITGTASGLTVGTATNSTNTTNTAITNDTTTAATMYPTWVTANTGNLPQKVSSTKLTFKPSTGELAVTAPIAANGLVLNANTVATSYTIAAGFNASSVGPITVNGGVVVTITAGQRWVVL